MIDDEPMKLLNVKRHVFQELRSPLSVSRILPDLKFRQPTVPDTGIPVSSVSHSCPVSRRWVPVRLEIQCILTYES
jgi:hypothetical protein